MAAQDGHNMLSIHLTDIKLWLSPSESIHGEIQILLAVRSGKAKKNARTWMIISSLLTLE